MFLEPLSFVRTAEPFLPQNDEERQLELIANANYGRYFNAYFINADGKLLTTFQAICKFVALFFRYRIKEAFRVFNKAPLKVCKSICELAKKASKADSKMNPSYQQELFFKVNKILYNTILTKIDMDPIKKREYLISPTQWGSEWNLFNINEGIKKIQDCTKDPHLDYEAVDSEQNQTYGALFKQLLDAYTKLGEEFIFSHIDTSKGSTAQQLSTQAEVLLSKANKLHQDMLLNPKINMDGLIKELKLVQEEWDDCLNQIYERFDVHSEAREEVAAHFKKYFPDELNDFPKVIHNAREYSEWETKIKENKQRILNFKSNLLGEMEIFEGAIIRLEESLKSFFIPFPKDRETLFRKITDKIPLQIFCSIPHENSKEFITALSLIVTNVCKKIEICKLIYRFTHEKSLVQIHSDLYAEMIKLKRYRGFERDKFLEEIQVAEEEIEKVGEEKIRERIYPSMEQILNNILSTKDLIADSDDNFKDLINYYVNVQKWKRLIKSQIKQRDSSEDVFEQNGVMIEVVDA